MQLSPKPHYWFLLVLGILLSACGGDNPRPTGKNVKQDTPVAKPGQYYQEALRPQIHLTPEKNWMGAPSGLVFLKGIYHLFYQSNPMGLENSDMHWGHATSRDLVQWAHHDAALAPDKLGTILGGSVVVDEDNSSGFGTAENPALIAIYTQNSEAGEKNGDLDFQNQSMSYSTDGGFTWTPYEGNPVLANPNSKDFRDPKVVWHKESKRWVMALAASDRVKFYTSPDLKEWEFASDFEPIVASRSGVLESPELFPIRDDRTGELRYVLLVSIKAGAPNGGSGTSYFVGSFDGTQFTLSAGQREPRWLDYGTDDYGFVTFSNAPTSAGRQLGIGWMSNWEYAQKVPTGDWKGAMTTARVLTLHNTEEEGFLLRSKPVPDHLKIRERKARFNRLTNLVPTDLYRTLGDWAIDPLEISMATPSGETPNFTFELASTGGDTVTFGYDKAAAEYFIDRTKINSRAWSKTFATRHTAKRKAWTKDPFLNILLDRTSIELFGDGGFTPLTDLYFLKGELTSIKLYGDEGINGTIFELGQILPTPVSVSRVQRPNLGF